MRPLHPEGEVKDEEAAQKVSFARRVDAKGAGSDFSSDSEEDRPLQLPEGCPTTDDIRLEIEALADKAEENVERDDRPPLLRKSDRSFWVLIRGDKRKQNRTVCGWNRSKVARTLSRLVSSVFILGAVVFVLALIIRINEAPVEDDEFDAAVAELETAETSLNQVFGFAQPLSELNCPGATSCQECVDLRSENRDPTLNPKRDVRINGTSICALTLPTVAQVEKCRTTNATILEVNPAYFEPDCLTDSQDCPNCNLLEPVLDELSFRTFGFTDPALLSFTYLQLAEPYVRYKELTESIIPQKYFTWEGSVYFAITITTTIGYGNFVPSTNASKLAICLLVIPCLALFGFALSQFAELILDLFRFIAHRTFPLSDDYPSKAKVRKKIIDFIMNTPYNSLQLPEVVRIFDGYKLLPQDKNEREEAILQIGNLFAVMDTKKELAISKGFILSLVMEYYDENEDRIERAQAVRELIMSLSFTVLFLFLGTAVFYETNRDRDWSALDALYFSMITLTTIGFGDFTPDPEDDDVAFWYFYILVGLGLLGALLGSTAFFVSRLGGSFEVGDDTSSKMSFVDAVKHSSESESDDRTLLSSLRILSKSRRRRSKRSPSFSARKTQEEPAAL